MRFPEALDILNAGGLVARLQGGRTGPEPVDENMLVPAHIALLRIGPESHTLVLVEYKEGGWIPVRWNWAPDYEDLMADDWIEIGNRPAGVPI